MAQHEKNILVVDVEATCWPDGPPPGQRSEIIEIGWCLLDPVTGAIKDSGTQLVRPEWSQVSAFCTELTTLTQEQVDGGVSFAEACQFLTDVLGSRSLPWASYGDYDRRQFTRQCEATGVAYPFSESHRNVKKMFGETEGLRRPVGMAEALHTLGLPLEGTHHRAVDDVRNIARILAYLVGPKRRPESTEY